MRNNAPLTKCRVVLPLFLMKWLLFIIITHTHQHKLECNSNFFSLFFWYMKWLVYLWKCLISMPFDWMVPLTWLFYTTAAHSYQYFWVLARVRVSNQLRLFRFAKLNLFMSIKWNCENDLITTGLLIIVFHPVFVLFCLCGFPSHDFRNSCFIYVDFFPSVCSRSIRICYIYSSSY